MDQNEFQELWKIEKSITADIHFTLSKGFSDVWSFDDVEIYGVECAGLFVNASYSCRTGSVSYNFVIKELGAIHRYCLGGPEHGLAGRFHQHILLHECDVRRQLPNVVPRQDLAAMSTKESWQIVCKEASITHTGDFFEPEELCN